jgi:hypothetical protein
MAGCGTTSGGGGVGDPTTLAKKLAADLGAVKERGSITIDGSTVRLKGEVYLKTRLTVPAGVTLDLTAPGVKFELQNGAKLTVDGTVIASGHGDHGKGWIEGGLRIGDGTTVINGSGTIRLQSKGCLLAIHEKRRLTLDGVTLVGIADNDNSLVQVGGGAELVMKSSKITGNTIAVKKSGGGVSVHNGTFAMSGNASISENTTVSDGGGVYFDGGGTFTMTDNAAVSGNTAVTNSGGVAVFDGVTFIMSGSAMVSGNTTKEGTGGVFIGDNSIFTMSDRSTVSGNTTGGLYGYGGGGVGLRKSSSTFIMNGGIVYGSSAHIPAGADKSLANTAGNGASASLYTGDFDRGTAKYGRARGSLTDFGPAIANGGLTEGGNKGTSRTLSVAPDTGTLTVTP